MKKTKIICTLGPASDSVEQICRLIENGMDIARFNFSHGSYDEHLKRLKLLKLARKEMNVPVAALLDTKGPEIRTGILENSQKIYLDEGKEFILTTKEIVGNDTICSINYDKICADCSVGTKILIDDGLIELEVIHKTGDTLTCIIKNGGYLGERKGVNIPNIKTSLPSVTDKDIEDIIFGIENDFDFVAASFIRNAEAVSEIKKIINNKNSKMQIISKIENQEGIDNIDEIIRESDGIMVARGDLGVEVPEEKVPQYQKMIIRKCSEQCKSVITATQMLDSMIRNPRPTRAEVGDVANAVYDGTDAVMLSGETAVGKYPVEAVKLMSDILKETEKQMDKTLFRKRKVTEDNLYNIANIICNASVLAAEEINAKFIAAPTLSGFTAKMLSKWRSDKITLGISPDERTLRQMQLYWGIVPAMEEEGKEYKDYIADILSKNHSVEEVEGDFAIIISGIKDKGKERKSGNTNNMRIIHLV
jgi:pyruvate kinase